jgi:predicted peptidase
MGGYAVWSLAYRNPNRFAAIVPICGSSGTGVAPKIKHIPTWVFHGALDRAISVNASRKMVDALRACAAPVTYTEYADGEHNVWDRAYRDPGLFKWMLEQRLPPGEAVDP